MKRDDFEPDDDDTADDTDDQTQAGESGTGSETPEKTGATAPTLTADEQAAIAEMRAAGMSPREALIRARKDAARDQLTARANQNREPQRTDQERTAAAGNPDDVITRADAEKLAQQHAAAAAANVQRTMANQSLEDRLLNRLHRVCRDDKVGYGKSCNQTKLEVTEVIVGKRLAAEQAAKGRFPTNEAFVDAVDRITKEVIAEDLAASGVKRPSAKAAELDARLDAQPKVTGNSGTNTAGTSWPSSDEIDDVRSFIAEKGRAPTRAEMDRAFQEDLNKFASAARR